ncbi:MAG: M23 family metallopeptidase [Clostridia bacterium]|nr:M23 family metallopeptidase [Clostridia bacterium]MBR1653725.1 M23 family metallopeptidase [Clostridia bacterium]
MTLKYPVDYIGITQAFKQGTHHGLDLGWHDYQGEPIYVSADGVVCATNDYDKSGQSWGNYVKIDHGNSIYTLYAHLKDGICVTNGQEVKQGDIIGYMGNTGYSFGTHLHFEVYVGGASTSCRVDPVSMAYVYPGQKVSSDDANTVKYYTPIVNSTIRNENKNQVEVLTELNVRTTAGLNGGKVGFVSSGIYDYYEVQEADGYTWYKISENQWIAQDSNNTYLRIYNIQPKPEPVPTPNPKPIKEEYKEKYNIEKDGIYKIYLKKGEILIIK